VTFMPALLLFVFIFAACSSAFGQPNVLLICVDDLRPELGCYGVSYVSTPNIDALANRGRIFDRHYVQAPTCGASRFTLLTGRYGDSDNNALFQRSARMQAKASDVSPSMPEWFSSHGYRTVAVGKVSHHPGGLGGPDWNSEEHVEMPGAWDEQSLPYGPWQHPRGWMHGLAHGEIRGNAKQMDVFQAADGDDSIYPDGPSIERALEHMEQLGANFQAKRQPFFLACGILRPHLPFGAPAKYLQRYQNVTLPPIPHAQKPAGKTTWHSSGEFMKYNRWGRDPNTDSEFADDVRRHYAACVSYADAQVGRLLLKLEQLKLSDDTIVVLWGDHGWHLGEHAVWGKHTLFEESLRSPLIVTYPKLPHPGEKANAVVETLDIFPTLTQLAGLPTPDFVDGVSLVPILQSPGESGHPACAYRNGVQTVRTDTHRLIVHAGGHTELYDHRSPEAETVNISEQHPDLTARLRAILQQRLRGPQRSAKAKSAP
jgi:iduronate 2-sulfatase